VSSFGWTFRAGPGKLGLGDVEGRVVISEVRVCRRVASAEVKVDDDMMSTGGSLKSKSNSRDSDDGRRVRDV
jgi:hypothetical protein